MSPVFLRPDLGVQQSVPFWSVSNSIMATAEWQIATRERVIDLADEW